MRVLPYMDDFLGLSDSRESALRARDYAESVLGALGLNRNPDKGVWDPIQRIEHIICTLHNCPRASVPETLY